MALYTAFVQLGDVDVAAYEFDAATIESAVERLASDVQSMAKRQGWQEPTVERFEPDDRGWDCHGVQVSSSEQEDWFTAWIMNGGLKQ